MKDDTISRVAAAKAICEDGTALERQGRYNLTMAERKQRDAEILEALPSAANINVGGNLIDRQEAIDALHKTMLDFFKTNDDDGLEFITASDKMLLSVNKAIGNALKKLPSAQLAQDLPKGCTDVISRQAAIDAMMKLQTEDIEAYGASIPEGFDGDRAVAALKALPSAQPTLYGYDIKILAFVASIMAKKGVSPEEAVTVFRDVNRVIEMMIEDMKEMQEDTLKKLYAVCPAESADMMGDDNDED